MDTLQIIITRDDLTEVTVIIKPNAEANGCYSLSIDSQAQGEVCFHQEDKYQWEFTETHLSYREQNQLVPHIQALI